MVCLTREQKKRSERVGTVYLELYGDRFRIQVYRYYDKDASEDYELVYGLKTTSCYLIKKKKESLEKNKDRKRIIEETKILLQKLFANQEKYDKLREETDHLRKPLDDKQKKKSSYAVTETLHMGKESGAFMFRVFISGEGRKNRTDYDYETGPGYTKFFIIRNKKKFKKLKDSSKEKISKIARDLISRIFDDGHSEYIKTKRDTLTKMIDYGEPGDVVCKEIIDNVLASEPGDDTSQFLVSSTYSIRNRLILLHQMITRGVTPATVNSRSKWKAIFGPTAEIKKGERAYTIVLPVPIPRKDRLVGYPTMFRMVDGKIVDTYVTFLPKNVVFTQTQTSMDKAILPVPPLPGFDFMKASEKLGVTHVAWNEGDEPREGCFICSCGKEKITINVDARDKEGCYFHSVAHIILGHQDKKDKESYKLSNEIKEAEAESVTLLCKVFLQLRDIDNHAKYLRKWHQENLTASTYKRISQATDKILLAGRVAVADNDDDI